MSGRTVSLVAKKILGENSEECKSVLLFLIEKMEYNDFKIRYRKTKEKKYFSVKVKKKLFGNKIKVVQNITDTV